MKAIFAALLLLVVNAYATDYSVALPAGASGPYTANVEMLFQSIGFRWAQNLRNYNAPEPNRFVGYYTQAAAQSSKLIARTAATVN